MKRSTIRTVPWLTRGLFLLFAIVACRPVWADDVSLSLVYTQFNINDDSSIMAALGTVQLQYSYASNTMNFSGNTTLFTPNNNPNFWSADGIVLNPQNGNFLVAGGGDDTLPGLLFQFTPSGGQANPFSFSFSPSLINYSDFGLTIVPSNGSNSGFTPGTLLATEKEYGFEDIVVYLLYPSIANGTAYPVTGDDVDVDSVAFDANGNAYYASGTVTSNDGNFGKITFNGTGFVTQRLTTQLLSSLYHPAHRLSYDSLSGDIFSVGGNEIGQYDPRTNIFHVLSIPGPANSFQFNNVTTDGLGHALVTACCGGTGNNENGAGDLILLDYSRAPGHLIDSSTGVQYTSTFLASSLGSVLIGPIVPTLPVISQQPQNLTTVAGQTATFTVSASGLSLNYQWESMAPGGSSFSPISEAISSSYTTAQTILSQSGTQYECIVSNSAGPVPSAAATLTVVPVGSTPPSGNVLYWSFDTSEDTGAVAQDQSGNNGNGTISGNPAQVAGKLNQALAFNGVNTSVTMNAFSDEATVFYNSITLAAWINTTNASRYEAIVSKYSAAGSSWGYIFRTDANGFLEMTFGGSDVNTSTVTAIDTTKINDGNWHHVVAVVNLGQNVEFYVDGTLSSTFPINTAGNGDDWSNLVVGVNPFTSAGNYFTGDIDEVRVYNVALTAAQVATVYQISGGGPVATLNSITVTPANPAVLSGATQAVTATGNYQGGGTQNLTNQVVWNSATPSVATVSSSGVVTAVTTGTSTITATLNGVVGSTVVTVPAPSSITVTPASPTITPGGTQAMTATANYAGGGTQNVTSQVTWASGTPSAATVSSSGVVTAVTTGTSTITATLNGVGGSTVVTVPAPSSITVTPANPTITLGGTQAMAATANYAGGGTQNVTSQVTWNSVTSTVATVSSSGVVTGVAGGTSTITATLNGVVGSTVVTVSAPTSITVTPANPTVLPGATQSLAATGNYSGGGTQNLTSQVTWSSVTPSVATVSSSGMVTAVAAGASTIKATLNGIVGSTVVTVPALSSITVTPANSSVSAGGTVQFAATGTYAGGGTQTITSQVTWSSGTPSVATISASGLGTGVTTGSTTIMASLSGISGSTSLGVTPVVTQAPSGNVLYWSFDTSEDTGGVAQDQSGNNGNGTISGSPAQVTGMLNQALVFNGVNTSVTMNAFSDEATAFYNSVTLAAWINTTNASRYEAIISKYSAAGSSWGYIFRTDQNGFLEMTFGGGDVTTSTVTAIDTTKINDGNWHHVAAVVNIGQNVQFYIDGNLSSTFTIGTIGNGDNWSNLVVGVNPWTGAGNYFTGDIDEVRVYNRALSAAEVATVYQIGGGGPAATLNSITVTPASPMVLPGATQSMIATGNYSNGTTQNLTSQVVWNSATPGAATVSGSGGVTGVATGTSTITATLNGVVGSTVVSVPSLSSITVTPANPTVTPAGKQSMTATGNYSNGGTQTLTSQVVWNSATPSTATVSSSGVLTGVATGTSTITAALGGIIGSTVATVSAPSSITVTPVNPTVLPGVTQSMTATANYSGGTTQNVTSQVTWNSVTPTVASVNSSGVMTGVATGTSTITATLSGVVGSTVVSVPALNSITVTPVNPSINAGATQALTATGNYQGGGTQNLTSQVTWKSATTSVATVSSSGVVTGISGGTSTISATLGSINGSTTVSVSSGGPLTVTPITLPNAALGQSYSVQLQASGGAAPYRWILVGGSLPPGLSLSSTGLLSGTPTGPAPGVGLGSPSPFYVYVIDANYNSVQPSSGFFLTVTN